MSDHEANETKEQMAEEDSVEVKENHPENEEKDEEDQVKEDEEENEAKEEQEESKESDDDDDDEEAKDEPAEDVEMKDEPEEEEEEADVPKEKKEKKKRGRKEKKEDVPAEMDTSVIKENDVPLYDQPLEMSGKRDRKKVVRFVQETKKEEISVTGSGAALGDIPFIEAKISKIPPEELKVLHRVAFNRPGSGNEIRKNLRLFNGFPFTKDDKNYQSKLLRVEKILMSEIKKMLMILGLERSGNKSEVVERLMEFMMSPKDSGKKPPQVPKKKSGKGRPSKKSLEKKQNNTSADDSESSNKSDSEQSGSEEEEEEEEEPEEKPKQKPGRKPAAAAAKKSPAAKKTAPKRTPATKRAKPEPDSDDSSSDDEPLAKKVKSPPSDAELKVMVKKILEGANLEEVTMKSVCRQVYDSYPDFDLTHKKLFIKETVKSIIS